MWLRSWAVVSDEGQVPGLTRDEGGSDSGTDFDEPHVRNVRRCYGVFPIRETLSPELSWSHHREVTKVVDQREREFYTVDAARPGLTVRELRRQAASSSCGRLLGTRKDFRADVVGEVFEREPRTAADDVLKDPYVVEFRGIAEPRGLAESDVEQGPVDQLQSPVLELGKEFSFVARQTCLPTREELRHELQRERGVLERAHRNREEDE